MRTSLTIALLSLLLSSSLLSQNEKRDNDEISLEENAPNLSHSLGVALSSTAGRGFSYRFKPKNFGVQLTTIPVFRGGGEYNINAGIMFMYEFFESEKFNIFSYLGSEVVFERFQSFIGPPMPSPDPYVNYGITNSLSSSIGAGFNFHLGTYFDLSVNLGYGVYRWYSTNNFENIFSNIDGGIGLYFKF